jgi:hypothetical protein
MKILCFKEFIIKQSSLEANNIPKQEDLIGNVFGRLTVVKKTDERVSGRIVWECRCECGKLHYATTSNLKRGTVKSCGCLQRDIRVITGKNSADDITNQKFGRLTAISPTTERKGTNIVWLCKCDCGNPEPVYATAIHLRSGGTRSCGCLRDEFLKAAIEKAGFMEGTCVSIIRSNKLSINNTSGVKGVTWDISYNKWLAQITFKGKHYHLGRYDDIVDAKKVRETAEENLHTRQHLDPPV